MWKHWYPVLWLFVAALSWALHGCGDGEGGSGNGSAGDAALRILVTDAPFPFDRVRSAIVEVQRIEIRRAGDFDEDGGGCETFATFGGGRILDLAQLRNGTTGVLFEGSPEPRTPCDSW
jgi:hypothetical protein